MEENQHLSGFAVAFILIGALFGAAFASGQEMMKFFCSYGAAGKWGFLVCFALYIIFGMMAYELSKIKNTGKMEDIVTPVDNPIFKVIVNCFILFSFMIILIALIAAGDSLFSQQLNFPKGIGGLLVISLVVATNIVGFDGIKKIMPVVVPIMLITVLAISLAILFCGEGHDSVNPQKYMSPLAPNWFIGAILYLAYNFIATLPVISTLPRHQGENKSVKVGMVAGFAGICCYGFMIYSAILTNIDVAGTFDLPMVFLAGTISYTVGSIYALIMIIAIYAAASNCLFGLSKEIGKSNKRRRGILICLIGLFGYCISLVGFAQIVTYAFPIQGYASIGILICMIIAFIKYKGKNRNNKAESISEHKV